MTPRHLSPAPLLLLLLGACTAPPTSSPAFPFDPAGLVVYRGSEREVRPRIHLVQSAPKDPPHIQLDGIATPWRLDTAGPQPRLEESVVTPTGPSPPALPGPPIATEAVSRRLPDCLRAGGPGWVDIDPHARESTCLGVSLMRTAPGPWEAGLYLRRQQDESRIAVHLSLAADTLGVPRYRLHLLLISPPTSTPLGEVWGPPVDGAWHHLALSLAGARIDLFWDHRLVKTCRTAFTLPGRAGLSSGAGRTLFKDLQLTAPPGLGRTLNPPFTAANLKQLSLPAGWGTGPSHRPGESLVSGTKGENGPGPWLYAVDWDGDGDEDILLSRISFPLALLECRGSAGYLPPRTLRGPNGRPLPPSLAGVTLAGGDLDGDGAPDLLLGCPDGTLRWYPGYWFQAGARPLR